jgi:hypothetical protein
LTVSERAEIEARHRESRDRQDRLYEQLLLDAQATCGAMEASPLLEDPADWNSVVASSLDDYRSGRSLMTQLGAKRLLDPATTGMLLAMRRGLVEETGAATMQEFMLIDTAVVAYANAMRLQSIVGNTALLIEAELFGQPSLRAKWKEKYPNRPPEVRGLALEEHVAKLRDQILPLIERFHGMVRASIEALHRMDQAPSAKVERSEGLSIVLAT